MRIAWFAPRPVWPLHGGGQVRMAGLIQAVTRAGHEVLLVQPEGEPAPDWDGLTVLGLELATGLPGAVAKLRPPYALRSPRPTGQALSEAQERIAAFAPGLVIVSDVHSCPLSQPLLGAAPFVYDAHNDETELYQQFLRSATGLVDRTTFWVDRGRVRRSEQQLVRRAVAVVAVSEQDAAVFRGRAPGGQVVVVPNSVALPERVADPRAAGSSVLFVGSLDYPPNVEALTELLEQVLPAVRRDHPETLLVVVGRRPEPALRALMAADPHCQIHEGAPDVAQFYRQVRCVVLPIRSGGGSRLKVFEALAHGVPLVATPQALSGVPLVHGIDAVVGGSWQELAEATSRLMSHPDEAGALGRAGREAFLAHLSWASAARSLLALIDDLGGGSFRNLPLARA